MGELKISEGTSSNAAITNQSQPSIVKTISDRNSRITNQSKPSMVKTIADRRMFYGICIHILLVPSQERIWWSEQTLFEVQKMELALKQEQKTSRFDHVWFIRLWISSWCFGRFRRWPSWLRVRSCFRIYFEELHKTTAGLREQFRRQLEGQGHGEVKLTRCSHKCEIICFNLGVMQLLIM